MIASKREKYIAMGTVAAIALLILDSFVIEPYFAQRDAIETQTQAATKQLADAHGTMDLQKRLQKVWAVIQSNGLKTQEAAADSQLQHAILDWAQQAGVIPQNLKSDQPRKEGNFIVIGYRVTATGSMRTIARFMWALETATIPIRVTDLRVMPQREGTDDLSVQVGVSTLCAPPEEKPAAGPAAPAPAPARPSTTPVRPSAATPYGREYGSSNLTGTHA